MKQSTIIDIISPIMAGPSSSHTAGAIRLGLMAKNIYNGKIKSVTFRLYNSFALTGKGHGTDKGLLAGLLGLAVDDSRIKNIFNSDISRQFDYNYEYVNTKVPEVAISIIKNKMDALYPTAKYCSG